MSRTRSVASDRRRRKLFTVLWVAVLAIVTIALIYWEMTALLYILATLGVTALLIVVAISDLAHGEKVSGEITSANDSAAIGSGITSTFGARQS